ncbi:hypothetical protein HDV01_001886 [Terramyces sp. JEL0728]|nr:hypothetical protein HDV01_001886 [Terramyces sp. JEL0728]
MPFHQSLSVYLVLGTLMVDYVSIFAYLCLLVGFVRAYHSYSFQAMQYSGLLQITVTIGLGLYSIMGKSMTIYTSWKDKVLYYDQIDIQTSNCEIISYISCICFTMCFVPIYMAALLQIYVMGKILDENDNFARRMIVERPNFVFGLGYLPGPIFLAGFIVESTFTPSKRFYSIVGVNIVPNINFYTIKIMYLVGISITIMACILSLKSIRLLEANKERMFAAAKKSHVPNYVVYQVLQIGYTLPIIGFTKGFELLMWYNPSSLNLYYGIFGMIVSSTTPLLGFIGNGAHKNIYPKVPIFGRFLKVMFEVITKSYPARVNIPHESSKSSAAAVASHPEITNITSTVRL